MIYTRMHRLIAAIAAAGKPDHVWGIELAAVLEEFQREVSTLTPPSARHIRDELCTQLEHEALRATDSNQRNVLFTALKRLESIDSEPS